MSDFSDLLIDSRRLAFGQADVSSSGGARNLRRGIAELEQAALQLAGSERQPKTHRLDALAVVGLRAPSKAPSFEVRTMHSTARSDAYDELLQTHEFSQSNIEGYLIAHQERAMLDLVDRAAAATRAHSEQMHRR